MYEMGYVKENGYPSSQYERVHFKNSDKGISYDYYENGNPEDARFEVYMHFDKNIQMGAKSRAYHPAKIPQKYVILYQELKSFFDAN